jgi:NADH:ubiquinone oxidoreductase subunit 5 (subunit L)/multisubunit Na+/H+ antiporter MnhA subunit
MFILALLFPFLGFVIATAMGRWSGKKGAALMSCIFMLLTNLVACLIWVYVFLGKSEVSIYLLDWISLDFLSLALDLNFDSLTANMMVVVTSISALVHIYSVSYMSEDPHLPRFMGLLSLFTFFMIWLITSSSLIQLFVGWEGVGVVSYLLVNFWYTRLAANRSAMMALLTNRVGDWGYSLGMFALIAVIGTLDFSTWFGVSWGYNCYINEIITLLLVIGVVGKSSQIGLHTWLPWAMEGCLEKRALFKFHYMREHP